MNITFDKEIVDILKDETSKYVSSLIYDFSAKQFAGFINNGVLYEEVESNSFDAEMVKLEDKPILKNYSWDSFLEEYTGDTAFCGYTYGDKTSKPETFLDYFEDDYKYIPDFDDFIDQFTLKYRNKILESATVNKKIKEPITDDEIINSFIEYELMNSFNDACFDYFGYMKPDMIDLYIRGCELLGVAPISDLSLKKMEEPHVDVKLFMKDLFKTHIEKAFNQDFKFKEYKGLKTNLNRWNQQIDLLKSKKSKGSERFITDKVNQYFKILKDLLSFDIGYEKLGNKDNYKDFYDLFLKNKEKWIDQLIDQISYYNSLLITHYNIPYKDVYACKGCLNYLYEYNTLFIFENLFLNEQLKEKIEPFINVNPKESYPEARTINRKFYIHLGETNTGKTYQAREALKKSNTGMYLAPLRLLALENQEILLESGCNCSLLTGEEEDILINGTHLSATVEMCDLQKEYDVCVIDECQLIEDKDRGWAWSQAILGVRSKEIHLCAAPYAEIILTQIIEDCGDSYEIIRHERTTDLLIDDRAFSSLKDVRSGDALIAFSKRQVLKVAADLYKKGINCSIIYGALPYSTRKKQFEMFLNGKTTVLVSTDAIAMGVNLPIKRVVFLESTKFDGRERRQLKAGEVKQIAGRAGRAGLFDKGYVNGLFFDKSFITKSLHKKIHPIKTAKIAFPKILLALDDSLIDTLKAWKELANYSFYTKTNIERQIQLLYRLKPYDLSKDIQFKLINIPFNEKDDYLLGKWESYVQAYKSGCVSIKKPTFTSSNDLGLLESNYKSLDLYYSFCKSMQLNYNYDEIKHEKNKIAEKIHQCLVEDIVSYRNTCKYCGKDLPWDYIYNQCQSCYDSGSYYWT